MSERGRLGRLCHLTLSWDVHVSSTFTLNVVYLATENDRVYAVDATGQTGEPLWHDNFTDPSPGIYTLGGTPQRGITARPVIDPKLLMA